MFKLDHIRTLVLWAGIETSIPPLGAFFGHRLLKLWMYLGILHCSSVKDVNLFFILAIIVLWIDNKAKVRHRCKKPNVDTKNSVVYRCHVCSNENFKTGTSKPYMTELCPPKMKLIARSDCIKLTTRTASNPAIVTESIDDIIKLDVNALPDIAENDPKIHVPTTPVTTLLDSERRKRTGSGAKKAIESGSSSAIAYEENTTGASNRRKRKSWTSLKEIAECDEQEHRHRFTKLAIPFVL